MPLAQVLSLIIKPHLLYYPPQTSSHHSQMTSHPLTPQLATFPYEWWPPLHRMWGCIPEPISSAVCLSLSLFFFLPPTLSLYKLSHFLADSSKPEWPDRHSFIVSRLTMESCGDQRKRLHLRFMWPQPIVCSLFEPIRRDLGGRLYRFILSVTKGATFKSSFVSLAGLLFW